jgi:hypothetical protein
MNFEDRYGGLDRVLYRMAFRTGIAQEALADVEELLYGNELPPVDDPVFLTALPRSGTTILLRVLCRTGHFASHTYRDMPFVLCPMLWNRFSAPFQTDDDGQERAHGDGLDVSGSSPEAFEEMVWKHFWPDHYHDTHIRPWRADDQNPTFNAFFASHMRKVCALRAGNGTAPRRYLSKNNLNVARLAAPPAPLRAGTFLVPFRAPLQQAASMYRQHQRFLEIHENDDFVREYMEAIGHHEFGKGLCPVDFDGWLETAAPPSDLAFWVQYWNAAYGYVLEHAGEDAVLVSYARLTEGPGAALARLAAALDVPEAPLVDQADRLQPPRAHDVDAAAVPAAVREEADALYDRLDRRADV